MGLTGQEDKKDASGADSPEEHQIIVTMDRPEPSTFEKTIDELNQSLSVTDLERQSGVLGLEDNNPFDLPYYSGFEFDKKGEPRFEFTVPDKDGYEPEKKYMSLNEVLGNLTKSTKGFSERLHNEDGSYTDLLKAATPIDQYSAAVSDYLDRLGSKPIPDHLESMKNFAFLRGAQKLKEAGEDINPEDREALATLAKMSPRYTQEETVQFGGLDFGKLQNPLTQQKKEEQLPAGNQPETKTQPAAMPSPGGM